MTSATSTKSSTAASSSADSSCYSDKEILQDSLMSQKHITDSYNTFAGECVNEKLRTTMLSILNEDHTIQADIFTMMQKNGWYETTPADAQMISQAKQKATSDC